MARPTVVVVGLGPADIDLMTGAARSAITQAVDVGDPIFFRTKEHPGAATLMSDLSPGQAHTFDSAYVSRPTFDAVYEEITSSLVQAARTHGRVLYAVPGSPFVAERTVEMLRARAKAAEVDLEFVAGLSFCDLAWTTLRIDPIATGVRMVDGSLFASSAASDTGPLLVAQCWSNSILSDIKLSIEEPAEDQTAVILHHLGLKDESVMEVAWADLDRSLEADHLTSVYVEGLGSPVASELMSVVSTIATLRTACPWDREQTHASLVRHLLEETYEAMEALEGLGDNPEDAPQERVEHAMEELGDLLCQVIFHATIAREEALFDLAQVARTLDEKLIRRHPHVFADVEAPTSEHVAANWEDIKRAEKARDHVFDGIPQALPALARAAAMERRLAGLGLGYGDTSGATSESAAFDEGDVLLASARRLTHGGLDPEALLRRALDRLGDRLSEMEQAAKATGSGLADIDREQRIDWFLGGVH